MEAVSHDLHRGLAQNGHDVSVLTTSIEAGESRHPITVIDGVKYIHLSNTPPLIYSKPFHNEVLKAFYELNELHNIDVIHSVSGAGQSICGQSEVPVVATWHGTQMEKILDDISSYVFVQGKRLLPEHIQRLLLEDLPKKKEHELQRYSKYNFHVAISPFMQRCVQLLGIENERIAVIRNSISDAFKNARALSKAEARAHLNIPNEGLVLGIAGRADSAKGHGFFLDAIKNHNFEFPLHVLLLGPDANLIPANFNHQITVKRLPRDEMGIAYRAMDLFINPTFRYSGFDLTVQESLAAGTNCLSSDLPQYEEFRLEVEKHTEYAPPFGVFRIGDKNSLISAINRMIQRRSCPRFLHWVDQINSHTRMISEYESLLFRISKAHR